MTRPVDPTDPDTMEPDSRAGAPGGPRPWRSFGVVGGLVVVGGLLGTTLGIATSDGASGPASQPVTAVETTPLWRCPNGDRVGDLADGDRVVMTGRSADGKWAQVRLPSDLDARAWVVSTAVDPDTATDVLPVAECAVSASAVPPAAADPNVASTTTTTPDMAVTTTAPATASPGRTPTTVAGGPGSTPSTPSTPWSTTVPDDTGGPTLTDVGVNPSPVWTAEQPGVPCSPPKPHVASVSLAAGDPSGVATVRLDWTVNGRTGTLAMSRTGTTWQATLGPFPADTLPISGPGMNQNVSITIVATDGAARTSTATTALALRSSAECFG